MGACGGFARIDGALSKHPDWDPSKWYAPPDEMTVGQFDDDRAARPAPHTTGYGGVAQYGMPYQGNMREDLQLDLEKGIPMPVEGSFLELGLGPVHQASDPETDTWGLRMSRLDRLGLGRAPCKTAGITLPRARPVALGIFNDGGGRGFAYAVRADGRWRRRLRQIGRVRGPVLAGKMASYWTGGGVGSTIPRVKDRFSWGLGPIEEGDRGPAPHHFTNQGQSHRHGGEERNSYRSGGSPHRHRPRLAAHAQDGGRFRGVAGPPEPRVLQAWMDRTMAERPPQLVGVVRDPPFIGASIEEGMQHIVDTSDRVLENNKRSTTPGRPGSRLSRLRPKRHPLVRHAEKASVKPSPTANWNVPVDN